MKSGVSVCVFAYNYEKYIEQALRSVLDQVTNFPVEIIIGDDSSTDSTAEIARSFQMRYPDKIFLSLNSVNIGGTSNWLKTIGRCRYKYIALLDGDDYFSDPHKLKKQFDALEADDELVMCFHSVEERYEDVEGKNTIVGFEKDIYSQRDFLQKGWFIRTSSTFFRNGVLPPEPPGWLFNFPYRQDTIFHVLLTNHGNAINIKEVMSVYRRHERGMSYWLMEDAVRNLTQEIALGNCLNEFTGRRHRKEAKAYISNLYLFLFKELIKSGRIFSNWLLAGKSLVHMNYRRLFKELLPK